MDSVRCEVCAVLPKNTPVFEGDYWMVSLSPDQGYLGRCYVTLKSHKGDLADLAPEEWAELRTVIIRYEAAVRKAFKARLFNWGCLMNNAFQVSPSLPHIHWHVRPRYAAEVTFAGHVFTDPNFGHHYNRDHVNKLDDSTLAQIRRVLQENI